jgi:hypothetical protein
MLQKKSGVILLKIIPLNLPKLKLIFPKVFDLI